MATYIIEHFEAIIYKVPFWRFIKTHLFYEIINLVDLVASIDTMIFSLCLFWLLKAHYGAKTAAAVTGLGLDNVYAVKVDGTGRMSLDDLEKKVEKAKTQVQ